MVMDFITGVGRADTQRALRGAYHEGTYENIVWMAEAEAEAEPCHSEKDHRWAVFVDQNTPDARSMMWHRTQRSHKMCNTCLWMDFDEGDPTFEQVVTFGQAVATGHEFLCYTSRSHGETRLDGTIKRKYRLIFPHSTKLPVMAYNAFGQVLSALARTWGLVPDVVAERPTQLCYLPNAGPEYLFHSQQGPRMDLGGEHFHWLYNGAMAVYAQQEADYVEFTGRNETDRSFRAAFARKHPCHELMPMCGFDSYDGDNWHHRDQSTNSFGTKIDSDGRGWVTSTGTIEGLMGRKNGDAYDLALTFLYSTSAELEAYARLCLKEADDARYGAATVDHGASLWDAHLQWVGEQKVVEEQEAVAEREEAKAYESERAAAESHKWGGAWLDQIPTNLKIKPSALEWAAWHAPGVIGSIVRAKAPHLKRHSLVPALMGAVSAVCYLSQGKFVSVWNEFITPSAIMIYLVGGTGSGKSDAMSTFYDVINMVDNKLDIRARRVGHLGSGPAVIDFMSDPEGTNGSNPNVFILQNEGGAKRAVGKGDKHQEGVIAEITDLHTAFEDGVEGSHTKTSGSSGFLEHPTLGGLFTSTPGKLFSAIDGADAESGWLGRNAFIPLKSTGPNMDRLQPQYPTEVTGYVKWLMSIIPPLPETLHPDVWHGRGNMAFHIKKYSAETQSFLRGTLLEYDRFARDPKRDHKEQALYSRALEMVNRFTFAGGLADGAGPASLAAGQWAKLIVDASCEYATHRMDRILTEEDLTPAGKVRFKIKALFERAAVDKAFLNTFVGGGKLGPNGDAFITKNGLRRKLLDSSTAGTSVIKSEMEQLVEMEVLVEMPEIGSRKVWLKYTAI